MIPIAYNVGSLAVRRTTTGAAVIGIALVVFVLAAALMLAAGVRRTLFRSGRPDVGMVIRKGSDAELSSNFEQQNVALIMAAPGTKKGEDGQAIGVRETVVVVAMNKVGGEGVTNVQFRGVTEAAQKLRPNVRYVAGRAASPGSTECVVGVNIRGRFKNLDLGKSVELRKNREVQVVGIFTDDGSSFESEVWCDLDVLRPAFGRDGVVSSVRVQLESAAAFEGFQAAVEQDKRLGLQAIRENVYYEKQSEGIAVFVTVLGALIAIFCSAGAMVGATITMYASVASRQREVGTLRAIGFSRRSVLASFVLESILIALIGGALGSVASMSMVFVRFSLMNFSTWSEIVFTFQPTPQIIGVSMFAAVVMGLLGGILPAIRAALLSPVLAMRGE